MSILLDTNVLSEGVRLRPDKRVDAFLTALNPAEQFVSVLSVGEIRFGIERLPAGKRRARLEHWLDHELRHDAAGQILPVTAAICDRWARMRVQARRTLPVLDSLIAATALHHGLDFATRNTKDFVGLGLRLLDPFA